MNRRVTILFLLVGSALAGASLIPDLFTWAVVPDCPGCTITAFSGWPGFVISALSLLVVAAAVGVWTDGRATGLWTPTLACGIAIVSVGVFAGLSSSWITPDVPVNGLYVLLPDDYSLRSGPWVAAAGGVLAIVGSVSLRQSSQRMELGSEVPVRTGWSPLVVAGGSTALVGGLLAALHIAIVGGGPIAMIYSSYLVVPLVITLSRSPRIWRPAAAWGFLGAGAMVTFLILDSPFSLDLFFAGAVLATVGSGVALFAPVDDLRGSPGPHGADPGLRVILGSVAFVAMIAGLGAIGAGSGAS